MKKLILFAASSSGVVPFLDYYGTKTRVEFSGSCLKQDQVTFNHKKVVNILFMRLFIWGS